MAESAEAHPSLEGIFRVLAQVPRERLLHYKHKLRRTRQDRKRSQLLHAMILLTLERETEARVSLDALRDDPAAARIYRSRWGSATANTANPIPPKQDAEVGLAVAQLYSLLVDEKLCGPPARDEAYRAAFAAFQSGNVGKDRLRSLRDEALEKCGKGFMPTPMTDRFSSRGGNAGTSPAPRTASDPVPIPSCSEPQPLRSTGTPTSFVSHFEISQSPTEPFLTHLVHGYGVADASKLCGNMSRHSARSDEEGNGLQPPAGSWSKSGTRFSDRGDEPKSRRTADFRGSRRSSSDPADPEVSKSTNPKRGPEGSLPHAPQSSCAPFGSAAPTRHPWSSAEVSFSSKETSSPALPSVSSPAPPSRSTEASPPGPEADAGEFFAFVVLHAREDEGLACRVKAQLESLGAANGATYSEDFLLPGRCQLGCFQDALDNSAFTLLLLTENFKSRFCAYQTSVALMDSFNRFCKTNTVIPFVSKERPLKQSEMPVLLASLVPLDENSPVFARRVQKTFTAKSIQEKKAAWSYRQQIRERERWQEQSRDYQQMLQHLSALGMNAPATVPFAGLPSGFPSGHGPYLYPGFPAPGTAQPPPGPDQPPVSQPLLLSLGSGGPQPHLIIQNAQMVQIGDYNHMQVERTNAVLGAAEEEDGLDQRVGSGVGNRHGD